MKLRAFREVRLIIYIVLFGNGIFVQYFSPMHYLCDYDGYYCSMCGMRKAIDSLISLEYIEAYESNPYIILVVLIGIVISIDTIYILTKWYSEKKKSVKKQ
jgi:hypothetical protein